jgi:hypothetical protein
MRAVIFISCKAPVDPVKLVLKYVEDVETTGVTRTRRVAKNTPFWFSLPPPLNWLYFADILIV